MSGTVEKKYNEITFGGLSVGNFVTASITETDNFLVYSCTQGFTPRRAFDPTGATLDELGEVVATLIADLAGPNRS